MARLFAGSDDGRVEYRDTGGSVWVPISIPGLTGYQLIQLKVLGPENLWASFSQPAGTELKIAHWDGVSWTVYTASGSSTSCRYGMLQPIPDDGMYVLWHNNFSYAGQLWRCDFDGTNWTKLWDSVGQAGWGPDAIACFAGTSGSDLYMGTNEAGHLDWVGLWHWNGVTMAREVPASFSPAIPWASSGHPCCDIVCLSSDLVLTLLSRGAERWMIYGGKFGAWTREFYLVPFDPDREVTTDGSRFYTPVMATDLATGEVFVFSWNYSYSFINWIRRRGEAADWSERKQTGETIRPPRGVAPEFPAGARMVFGGGNELPYYDVLFSADAGDTWVGYDIGGPYESFYAGAIALQDTVAPIIDSNFPTGTIDDTRTNISFKTKDVGGSGVNLSSIACQVGGEDAIIAGVFQTGWDGPGSSIIANAFDGFDVVIDPTSQLHNVVNVAAYCEDNNSNPQTLEWSFEINDFIKSITHSGPNTLRVTFREPALLNAGLCDPPTYGITPTSSGVGVIVSGVTCEDVAEPTWIELAISKLTGEAPQNAYRLEILSGVLQDSFGEYITEPEDLVKTFDATPFRPIVQRAYAADANLVDIEFSESMEQNEDIINPSNYSIDGGLAVLAVSVLSNTTVRLYVNPAMATDQLYTVTVTP